MARRSCQMSQLGPSVMEIHDNRHTMNTRRDTPKAQRHCWEYYGPRMTADETEVNGHETDLHLRSKGYRVNGSHTHVL
ncbi:hypothetical protein BaRGS_00037067 [Batillaria attramentaria]|uniref:Uncharacterized protein n=1 Tax=Batillaria attramentaria TaxID=370345 RepID=A0ABD0JA53_9CAEN